MSKKIYYNQSTKLNPNPTTGHKGTPIRIIDEFEGQAACEYQLDYLKHWRDYFNKHSYTKTWFENVKVMDRQKVIHKLSLAAGFLGFFLNFRCRDTQGRR